jgi:hypothetical protein
MNDVDLDIRGALVRLDPANRDQVRDEFYRFVDNLRATGFSDLQIVTLLVETTAVFAELIATRTSAC